MKTLAAIALALAAIAVPVLAQDTPMRGAQTPVARADVEAKLRARLAAVDANRDGKLTREEMRTARQAKMAERRGMAFDRLDADDNGAVSRDEFTAMQSGEGQRAGKMKRIKMARGMGGMRALADTDGSIAIDAAVKAAMSRFDAADANRDGTLTPKERQTARQARMQK